VGGAMVTKLCECIDVRAGESKLKGGIIKPVFILELGNNDPDDERKIIKYLQCNRTTNDSNYKVPIDSDFAKLYRSTIGENPRKRFSKAAQLMSHFVGYWFIAEFDLYKPPTGEPFFKVARIKAESPAKNDAWTLNGTLKKTSKKRTSSPLNAGDKQAKDRRPTGEKEAKNKRLVGDNESLQASNSLGLELDFHHIKRLPNQDNTTNTQDHVLGGDRFLNQTCNVFNYFRLENETTSDYFDRVIADSFKPETWVN